MAENAQRAQQMDNLRKLTLRQLEVLILLSNGVLPKDIAAKLGVEVQTVSTARGSINQQLATNTYKLESYYPLINDLLDELQAQLIPLPPPIIPRSTQPFRWLAGQSELVHTALLIVVPLALLALLAALTVAWNRPPIIDRQEVPVTVVVPGAAPPPVTVIVAGPTPPPVVIENTVIVERAVTLVPVNLTPRPGATTIPTTATTIAPLLAPTVPPAVPPTLVPTPVLLLPGALAFGETWEVDGLKLTFKPPAHASPSYLDCLSVEGNSCTALTFVVQNTTAPVLDFAASPDAFYILLSNGTRFTSPNPANFSNIDSTPREFSVHFPKLSWTKFPTILLPTDVTYYVVGVKNFSSKIKEAQWKEDLHH